MPHTEDVGHEARDRRGRGRRPRRLRAGAWAGAASVVPLTMRYHLRTHRLNQYVLSLYLQLAAAALSISNYPCLWPVSSFLLLRSDLATIEAGCCAGSLIVGWVGWLGEAGWRQRHDLRVQPPDPRHPPLVDRTRNPKQVRRDGSLSHVSDEEH